MALTALSIHELLELKPPPWLIEGTLPQLGLLAVYGAPGDGKTFAVLDMAMCVATGTPWHGKAVQKGYVIYISAEGGGGIGKRVGAWLDEHGIGKDDYATVMARFIVSTISVHPDSEDLQEILNATVDDPEYQHELANYVDDDEAQPPLLIVVDTLARCFVGDENQQEDMGAFVRALDALRENNQATVLVVHHTNAGGDRERGNTAFRGACDTMVQVSKDDMELTLRCTKQKDAEPFADLSLTLTPVPAWLSCVVRTSVEQTDAGLDEVRECLLQSPHATVREVAGKLGLSVATAYRRIKQVKGAENTKG